jgi:putative transposase
MLNEWHIREFLGYLGNETNRWGLEGNGSEPTQKREHVQTLRACYEVSERRACRVMDLSRHSCRYRSRADEQAALRIRIRDLAYARVSYVYRRLHVLLQCGGWRNHKRVYRLYRLEGLMMRPRKPRRYVTARRRMERMEATAPNEGWSMDLMADELFNGQRIRLLTLVDNFTRESLAIEVDSPWWSPRGGGVAENRHGENPA